MAKIDKVEAHRLRKEGLSLTEIGKRFDATGQAVHQALKKPLKSTQRATPTLSAMNDWAVNAAQAFADEPRKNGIIAAQATEIKTLTAQLQAEQAYNKKWRQHERLFDKANKSNPIRLKLENPGKENFTYHIALYELDSIAKLADFTPSLNISEGVFVFN